MSTDYDQRRGIAHDLIARGTSDTEASKKEIAHLAERPLLPNKGIPLDLNWIEDVRINTSAVERRAQTHIARRTVKKTGRQRGFCAPSPAWT